MLKQICTNPQLISLTLGKPSRAGDTSTSTPLRARLQQCQRAGGLQLPQLLTNRVSFWTRLQASGEPLRTCSRDATQ